MGHNALEYMASVFDAHEQLNSGNNPEALKAATERLRAVAPNHMLLPLLETKWQSMVTRAAVPVSVAPPYVSDTPPEAPGSAD